MVHSTLYSRKSTLLFFFFLPAATIHLVFKADQKHPFLHDIVSFQGGQVGKSLGFQKGVSIDLTKEHCGGEADGHKKDLERSSP